MPQKIHMSNNQKPSCSPAEHMLAYVKPEVNVNLEKFDFGTRFEIGSSATFLFQKFVGMPLSLLVML